MFLTLMLLLKIGLFTYITRTGHNQLLIFLISSLITVFLFTLIYLSKLKIKNKIAFLFYFLMSTTMFIDIMYYQYFNSLPSIATLKNIGLMGVLEDSLKSFLDPIKIWFIIDIPFMLLRRIRRKKTKVTYYNKEARLGVPLGILATIILVFAMVNFQGDKSIIKAQEIYIYHITDIISNFLRAN